MLLLVRSREVLGINCTCLAHNIVIKLGSLILKTSALKLLLQSDTPIQNVYLKVYANHLKGVQVMATVNLQCNSLSLVSRSQTAFFFYLGEGKRSGISNSKFLCRPPPRTGWVMIGDEETSERRRSCFV